MKLSQEIKGSFTMNLSNLKAEYGQSIISLFHDPEEKIWEENGVKCRAIPIRKGMELTYKGVDNLLSDHQGLRDKDIHIGDVIPNEYNKLVIRDIYWDNDQQEYMFVVKVVG